MGDRSKSELYTKLLGFLKQHGKSLATHGSNAHGLSMQAALEFIELLKANDVHLLGIEIWRCKDEKYVMDISTIWYSSVQCLQDYEDASEFLGHSQVLNSDLVTIQFA